MRANVFPACLCDCHQDGQNVMHCYPCCDVCGSKFIDKNGSIDLDRYKIAQSRLPARKAPYIDGCEFVVKNKKLRLAQ